MSHVYPDLLEITIPVALPCGMPEGHTILPRHRPRAVLLTAEEELRRLARNCLKTADLLAEAARHEYSSCPECGHVAIDGWCQRPRGHGLDDCP
jgi:predicted RNA-binding Zn-ribbon protein involved in translation (DUF1610 family)